MKEMNTEWKPELFKQQPDIVRSDDEKEGLSLIDLLRTCKLSEQDLENLTIPQRAYLIGGWFRENDLGFVCAKRGAGKTWFGLHLARCLAEGRSFGPWEAHQPTQVLYIDGEMPLDEMRDRTRFLRSEEGRISPNLHFFSHQQYYDVTHRNLSLSDYNTQEGISALCEADGIRVLFIDNQSTLFPRVRENSADDWRDMVECWLLNLRRRGIAVIIINHAGRNGEMRGTSKREDPAFWEAFLDPLEKEGPGARFLCRFEKNRNDKEDPITLTWQFQPEGNLIVPKWQPADTMSTFRDLIEIGLNNCADIADELKVSKATVSRMATTGIKQGWLEKRNREYYLVKPYGHN